MFKRRTPRGWIASVARALWPRGGWARAIRYLGYRLRRLPDPAHKISRGIAAGVFACWTPFFGLHFLISAGLAWALRGNVLAALLATFVGNPITFPVIAAISMELGSAMLGIDRSVPLYQTFAAFSKVSIELWSNLNAIFTNAEVEWRQMSTFMDLIFMPYLVGGLVPGTICGCLAYVASRPIIAAYQNRRINKARKKFQRQRDRALAERRGPANHGVKS